MYNVKDAKEREGVSVYSIHAKGGDPVGYLYFDGEKDEFTLEVLPDAVELGAPNALKTMLRLNP